MFASSGVHPKFLKYFLLFLCVLEVPFPSSDLAEKRLAQECGIKEAVRKREREIAQERNRNTKTEKKLARQLTKERASLEKTERKLARERVEKEYDEIQLRLIREQNEIDNAKHHAIQKAKNKKMIRLIIEEHEKQKKEDRKTAIRDALGSRRRLHCRFEPPEQGMQGMPLGVGHAGHQPGHPFFVPCCHFGEAAPPGGGERQHE